MASKDEKAIERITEDAPFEIPLFNEKDFIRKELISFKTTLILFGFSVIVSLVSFLVWRQWTPREQKAFFFPMAVLVVGVGLVAIRFLFKALRIDMSHWGRKEWFGTGSLYFFFWLGFFLLIINPPLTDRVGPQVELVAAPLVQFPGQPIQFGAYLADNVAVQTGTTFFCILRYEGPAPPSFDQYNETVKSSCAVTFQQTTAAYWNHTARPIHPGKYVLYGQAMDKNGQLTRVQSHFEVGNPFSVLIPEGGSFNEVTDEVRVNPASSIRDQLRAVQFSLDGTDWHNLRKDEDTGVWKTDPSYEGWKEGAHQLRIRALGQPSWVGNNSNYRIDGGEIQDTGGPYNVTISAGTGVGQTENKEYAERAFRPQGRTPGLGVPLLLIASVSLAVLVRRSRHDGP